MKEITLRVSDRAYEALDKMAHGEGEPDSVERFVEIFLGDLTRTGGRRECEDYAFNWYDRHRDEVIKSIFHLIRTGPEKESRRVVKECLAKRKRRAAERQKERRARG